MVLSALGAVGSAAGGLMSGIGSLFGRGTSARSNVAHQMNLMAYQNKLQTDYDRNRYQNSVYSLREAGLNPILAASNGISAGSGSQGLNSSSPTPSADFSQLGEQISNLAMNTAMIKKTNAEAENIAQNTALQGAQTSLTIKQLDTEVARLGNILEDTKLKFDQCVQIKAQIMNLKQERNNLVAMENQIKTTTSNIMTDTATKTLENDILQPSAEFARKHPVLKNLGNLRSSLSDDLSKILHGGSSAYNAYNNSQYRDYEEATTHYDSRGRARSSTVRRGRR